MKKIVPIVATTVLGLALAWTANADLQSQAQPQNAQLHETAGTSETQAQMMASRRKRRARKSASTKKIQWRPSLAAAFAEAKRTGKPIMADFYATWCEPCQILDKAYEQPALVTESQKWVLVKVDVDKHTDVIKKYDAGSLPTVVFFGANGKELGRKVGFSVPESVKTMDGLVKHLSQDVIKDMRTYRAKSRRR